jgi:hypothetical protein
LGGDRRHIFKVASCLRLEWLAHSSVRAELGLHGSFGDDALAYCTERMDPETTRVALAAVLRQAKRNKAFENSRFIGLALDGTSAGRTYQEPRPLPQVGDDVLKAALSTRTSRFHQRDSHQRS